jgi:hypothetical protein
MAAIMAAGLVVLALLAAVATPAHATDYVVGDSSGWASGVDYATWASSKTFAAGDNLGESSYTRTSSFNCGQGCL